MLPKASDLQVAIVSARRTRTEKGLKGIATVQTAFMGGGRRAHLASQPAQHHFCFGPPADEAHLRLPGQAPDDPEEGCAARGAAVGEQARARGRWTCV